MSPVVAVVTDLMDRSRISSASAEVRFVGDPAAVAAEVDPGRRVVVDLSVPGAIEALPAVVAAGASVVAYGSHVARDVLAAAEAAGCDQVLARSAFFSQLPDLLG